MALSFVFPCPPLQLALAGLAEAAMGMALMICLGILLAIAILLMVAWSVRSRTAAGITAGIAAFLVLVLAGLTTPWTAFNPVASADPDVVSWAGSFQLPAVLWCAALLAVGVSLPARFARRRRRATGIGGGVAALAILGGLLATQVPTWRGHRQMTDLLAGSQQVHLTRVAIEHGMRRMVCTDPTILAHLERCLREAQPVSFGEEGAFAGSNYETIFAFAGGGSSCVDTNWSKVGLTVEFCRYRRGAFPADTPAMLAQIAAFLDMPYQQGIPNVLTVDAQGAHLAHNPGLDWR